MNEATTVRHLRLSHLIDVGMIREAMNEEYRRNHSSRTIIRKEKI